MQKTLIENSNKLSEYGVAGIVLAILFPFVVILVWYIIRNTNKVLREKDEYIKELNERRVEAAAEAVAAITIMADQLKRLLPKGGDDA